jgi:hypothetical protein
MQQKRKSFSRLPFCQNCLLFEENCNSNIKLEKFPVNYYFNFLSLHISYEILNLLWFFMTTSIILIFIFNPCSLLFSQNINEDSHKKNDEEKICEIKTFEKEESEIKGLMTKNDENPI